MTNQPADPNLWANPEAPAPKKSKTLRNWLLGCGGCFVVALIAFAVIAWMATSFFKRVAEESKDPKIAWPKVQAVLPFATQPQSAEVKAAFTIMGLTNLALSDKRNDAFVYVMRMPSSEREGFDQLFDPHGASNSGVFGIGGVEGAVAGELALQGRTVRTLYFRGRATGAGGANADGRELQQLRIDLSPETGNPVLMHYAMPNGTPEELGAAAVVFLSEFQLWSAK